MNIFDKIFTKKYQKKIYKKQFDIFKIFLLMNSILNYEDNSNIKDIKLLKIINKMFNSIFIENNGIIKLDKQLFGLVEKYNIIVKKKICNHKKLKYKNVSNSDTDDNTSAS